MAPDSLETSYLQLHLRLASLLEGETDEIAVMATIACELRHSIDRFDWVGFYRVTSPGMLTIGPYQGPHGCLRIPFGKGVCGKCARDNATQIVSDVTALPYHIACSNSTRSEIVVPVVDNRGIVRAVLDIDSNTPSSFDETDRAHLERICALLSRAYGK